MSSLENNNNSLENYQRYISNLQRERKVSPELLADIKRIHETIFMKRYPTEFLDYYSDSPERASDAMTRLRRRMYELKQQLGQQS